MSATRLMRFMFADMYFSRGCCGRTGCTKASVAYVRAEAQAAVFDVIWDELSPDERAVARRGKNHKITSMPHNVNQLTYKKATAFEALLGYLNLSGDAEREKEIIQRTFEIIESSDIAVDRGNRK